MTNKGISHWPSVLAGDEVLAGAILDRLLHNATVLNIQGRSYRLKELDARLSDLPKPADPFPPMPQRSPQEIQMSPERLL